MFAYQNRASYLSSVGKFERTFAIFRLVSIFREIRLFAAPYL